MTVALLLVAASTLASSAPAQSPDRSPSTAAAQFFAALNDHRSADAAAMVDSTDVEILRNAHLSMLIAGAKYRADQAHQRRDGSGGMSGYSSDGLIHPEMIARYGSSPIRGFGSATTLAEVAALDPREFLARALAASAAMLDSSGAEKPAGVIRTVLGQVLEGDSVAHIVYRTSGAGVRFTDPLHAELLRLRRHGGSWWIDLTVMDNQIMSGVLLWMANDDLKPSR
jgi:hypothetical protein